MSLWFYRRDEQGRSHWYSVEIFPIAIFLLLILIATAFSFLLPLL